MEHRDGGRGIKTIGIHPFYLFIYLFILKIRRGRMMFFTLLLCQPRFLELVAFFPRFDR